MQPRVVITGIGLVTPLGVTTESTWRSLLSGTTAVQAMPSLQRGLPPFLSARVDESQLPPSPPLLPPTPTFARFALHAAHLALVDAALLPPPSATPSPATPGTPAALHVAHGDHVGISLGVGMAHLPDIASAALHLDNDSARKISPYFVPRILPNTAAGLVALRHGLRGPCLAPSTACAAGLHAVADGLHALQRGDAAAMLVGGAEAAVHPLAVAGFARARALAACTPVAPFDRRRAGFALADGAAVLVLECADSAVARGARVYARVVGFGMSGDAYHVTSPPSDGGGAERAMRAALAAAARSCGMTARDVGYVSAHATGTPVGDIVERRVIARLLPHGDNAHAVTSATKGATGHPLGAAGAIEAAFTALAVADGIVPPTVGLRELDDDEECHRLGWGRVERYVPDKAVRKETRLTLCNSFGFGGTNACVAIADAGDDVPRKTLLRNDASLFAVAPPSGS